MSNLTLKKTPLQNLILIEHQPNLDDRGSLTRQFCQKTLNHLMNGKMIKQINRTSTINKGTVRGLHFQYPPNAETKIITCLKGKVWDVAIDLRKGSPTFLHYHAQILTEDDHKSYLVPEGFAHGFQSLTSNCELLYFHTANYKKESEGAINAVDPIIGIEWPEPIYERSKRDSSHPMLADNFKGIDL